MRFLFTLLCVGVILVPTNLLAAPKLSKRLVSANEVQKTSIQYGKGKAKKKLSISCLGKVSGTASSSKGKTYFTSHKDEEKYLKKLKRLTSKQKAKLALLIQIKKNAPKACAKLPAPPSDTPPPSTPTPKPDQLLLDPYTGSFGKAEAQILYNRFGFGGTPEQIGQAVQVGLAATVERLLTFVSEPQLEDVANDIICDSWIAGDSNPDNANKTCDALDVNDFSRDGLKIALVHKFIYSQNPFLQKFAFFLMDERLAVAASAADSREKHAIKTYVNSVYKAASTGDYTMYMKDMMNDHLMHLRWLDGSSNRGGFALLPNENFAREFWELGTTGPTDLDGNPVYGDLDIAQGALAFTGWNIDQVRVRGKDVYLASWVPMFHSFGPKTVFNGTPFQATVDTAEDLLAATFRHPRTSEHLAEDIWAEFINPHATAQEIRELAAIIRDNNYNLLPVFKKIMLSKALYAGESRNSLIKHPLDMVVGFIKTTGYPIYYRNYLNLFSKLEQIVLEPATVFGWNVRYLAGQQLQIEWWNVLVDYFINPDIKDIKEKYNWSYYDRFVANGPQNSGEVIDRVASDFAIALTTAQKAELEQLMNYYLTKYQCPSMCNGMSYRLIRQLYDTNSSSAESAQDGSGQRKLRQLISALLEMPEFRTK